MDKLKSALYLDHGILYCYPYLYGHNSITDCLLKHKTIVKYLVFEHTHGNISSKFPNV
jgi:hypothetical protein